MMMFDSIILEHEQLVYFDGLFYPLNSGDSIRIYKSNGYEEHEIIYINGLSKIFGKVIAHVMHENRGVSKYASVSIQQIENLLGRYVLSDFIVSFNIQQLAVANP